MRFHSDLYSENRRAVLTLHVCLPGDSPWNQFANLDATRREESLRVFASTRPSFPVHEGAESHLPIEPLDLSSLNELLGVVHHPSRKRFFASAVAASPKVLQSLGLFWFGDGSAARGLARFGPDDTERLFARLAALLNVDGASLGVTLASVSDACERQWVFEDELRALGEAARAALTEIRPTQQSALGAAFDRFGGTWQAVRQEVKPQLEALIESISKLTFETFEEKSEVAARLNELLEEWRFRAISPSTGRAAYFQCRSAARSPKGHFFFQDIDPDSAPVGDFDPDGPKAPSRVPAFKLTDIPPNPRKRQPGQSTNTRESEEK